MLRRRPTDDASSKYLVGTAISPIRVVIPAARSGIVTVIKPGKEFAIVAQNDMQEPITASPVVAGGRIYLRSFDALYAIGK